MRPITDIKELRSIQIAILDSIVDVCDKYKINYTLAAGTLIGALRHKGYIPWDDDIDLFMMRTEYEKFLKVYNEVQKIKGSPFELLSPEITDKYYYSFGKVVDNRTLLIEENAKDFPIGVYVDIFALDFVQDNETLRNFQFKIRDLLVKIRNCKLSPTCCLKSRIAYLCYKYLTPPLSWIEWLQKKCVFLRKPTSLIFDMHSVIFRNTAFSAKAMQSFSTAEFEGKKYKIMAGYDEYLTKTYKFHYMTLPPEDQRVHHQFIAWWK